MISRRVCFAALLPLTTGCLALLEGERPLATLDVSPGRGFSLRAELSCELACRIRYRVSDPAHDSTPWSYLGHADMDPGEPLMLSTEAPGDLDTRVLP